MNIKLLFHAATNLYIFIYIFARKPKSFSIPSLYDDILLLFDDLHPWHQCVRDHLGNPLLSD